MRTHSKNHHRTLALAILVIAGATIWLTAQASNAQDKATEADAPAACCGAQSPALGRTVRLEFKLEHEEESPRFPIVSAGGDFEVTREEMGPEFEHHLSIRGEVMPTDDKDVILVHFVASTGHSDVNDGHEGTFSATGSAMVAIGKELHLTDLGEAPLSLTAIAVK